MLQSAFVMSHPIAYFKALYETQCDTQAETTPCNPGLTAPSASAFRQSAVLFALVQNSGARVPGTSERVAALAVTG